MLTKLKRSRRIEKFRKKKEDEQFLFSGIKINKKGGGNASSILNNNAASTSDNPGGRATKQSGAISLCKG